MPPSRAARPHPHEPASAFPPIRPFEMTTLLPPCVRGFVAALAALAASATPMAQDRGAPTSDPGPAYPPFVDASGVVSQNLRRSAVLKALGPPPRPDPKVPLLRYPHLGLSFALPNEGAGNKG